MILWSGPREESEIKNGKSLDSLLFKDRKYGEDGKSSGKGRCIGLDVPEDLDWEEFDEEMKKSARGKDFTVSGERK